MKQDIKDVISHEIQQFLENAGSEAVKYKTELDNFLLSIEPQIDLCIAKAAQGDSASSTNLLHLQAQMSMELGKLAIQAIDDYNGEILAIVRTAVHTIIAVLI